MSESERTSFRKKALASLAATAGMLLLPVACLMLETYGPSGRIVAKIGGEIRHADDSLMVRVNRALALFLGIV